jgi:hypothetical protein
VSFEDHRGRHAEKAVGQASTLTHAVGVKIELMLTNNVTIRHVFNNGGKFREKLIGPREKRLRGCKYGGIQVS